MTKEVRIDAAIADRATEGPGYAIAFAILRLADAQHRCADELRRLGNADANTPFGAIEALGMQVGKVGEAIDGVASAINAIAAELGSEG